MVLESGPLDARIPFLAVVEVDHDVTIEAGCQVAGGTFSKPDNLIFVQIRQSNLGRLAVGPQRERLLDQGKGRDGGDPSVLVPHAATEDRRVGVLRLRGEPLVRVRKGKSECHSEGFNAQYPRGEERMGGTRQLRGTGRNSCSISDSCRDSSPTA